MPCVPGRQEGEQAGGVSGRTRGGTAIEAATRSAFISGMNLCLLVAAVVAFLDALIALLAIPAKASARTAPASNGREDESADAH